MLYVCLVFDFTIYTKKLERLSRDAIGGGVFSFLVFFWRAVVSAFSLRPLILLCALEARVGCWLLVVSINVCNVHRTIYSFSYVVRINAYNMDSG